MSDGGPLQANDRVFAAVYKFNAEAAV